MEIIVFLRKDFENYLVYFQRKSFVQGFDSNGFPILVNSEFFFESSQKREKVSSHSQSQVKSNLWFYVFLYELIRKGMADGIQNCLKL